MTSKTAMTISLVSALEERLGRLADTTRRSKAHLAAEAIAHYVDRKLGAIEGVERGLADLCAGRVVPHEAAMMELEDALRLKPR